MKKTVVSLSVLAAVVLSAGSALADTVLYNDGPVDGNTVGLYICGPSCAEGDQTISDGFVASASGTVTTLDFTEWVSYNTTPTSISWSLGTTAFAGNISSGSTPLVNSTFLFMSSGGFEIYNVEVTGLSGSLVAGQTYYLTLGGANDSGGTQLDAWDVNGGPATCSVASGGVPYGTCTSGNGDYGGESFTLSGNSSSVPTPEPGSLLLLGSGTLGFAGVLRRKFAR